MALTLPLVVKANEQGFAPCDGATVCFYVCVCVGTSMCALCHWLPVLSAVAITVCGLGVAMATLWQQP